MCKIGQKIGDYVALAALSEGGEEIDANEFEDAADRLKTKYGKLGFEEMSRLPYYNEFATPVDLMHCIQVNANDTEVNE